MARQVMKLFHPTLHFYLRCTFLLCCVTGYNLGFSQKVIKNEKGEKIIQYEDGTWRYFEGRDSMLESDLWDGQDIVDVPPIEPLVEGQPIQYDYRLFQKYVTAAVRYESEMLDKVDQSSDEAHSLEDQIQTLASAGEMTQANELKEKLRVVNEQRQNDQRLLSYARSLIKKILKVGKNEKYEKLEKIYVPGLNTELEQSPKDSLLSKNTDNKILAVGHQTAPDTTTAGNPEISTENHFSASEKEDKSLATDETTQPNKSSSTLNTNMADDTIQTLPNEVSQLDHPKEENDTYAAEAQKPSEEVSPPVIDSSEAVSTTDQQSQDLKEEPEHDQPEVMQHHVEAATSMESPAKPGIVSASGGYRYENWFSTLEEAVPKYQCEFTFHGIDDFTNTMKKELKAETFFSYTDERLKPYLKENDYVTCRGYLTSISGGFRYLTLIFTIASKNATREYGYIKTGSILNLKLLDGETVSLFTQSENQGSIDAKNGFTTYKVRYPIDYQKEKILLKSGVDKVRVVWSSGYEDYEVFNIDFFINQLECLNNK
ncbi:MAG: hypothetical protein KDC53_20655 [Saprospiraceae bacterium]|nr:hypothetical protein [Saprospiraceae bacterium]